MLKLLKNKFTTQLYVKIYFTKPHLFKPYTSQTRAKSTFQVQIEIKIVFNILS